MAKYLVELIGAFFLMLVISMSVLTPGAGSSAPIAIGLLLMAMIFAGYRDRQWHYYNPALALAEGLANKLGLKLIGGYWLAQVVGALLAVPIILYFKRAPIPLPDIGILPIALTEALFTFALSYAAIGLSQSKWGSLRVFVPVAVGAVVVASAYAIGAVSGAMLNPAITIAMMAVGLLPSKMVTVYLAAQLLAALAAWLVWRVTKEG